MQPPTSGADPYYPSGTAAYPPPFPQSGVPAPPVSGYPSSAPTTSAYPPSGFPPYPDASYGAPLPPPPGRRSLLPLVIGGIVALIVVAAVAFTAGYFVGQASESDAETPRAVTSSAPAAPSASPSAAAQQGVAGVWKGTYTCNQGETGLTLTIEGQDSALEATFEFYATSTNTDVPSGSYSMAGNVTGGTMRLIGTAWINQPDGYGMVNLTSTSISATTITGTVEFSGCSTFTLTRS
ncbi:hypothetical protein [Cryptosporangium phraense]|uniref:Uncharacterized protein n=1 Tax=Cryptosporangium phraense TaxID=2593070 RepID=A0A545AWW0_9ACTN|nr:hypothetical protein [Cryptosporangium phraense]TQS45819.1 hypothetical protein FL583_04675 [Cryptosporangium phraense]